ncbi:MULTISPECIES: FMN-dependent NADH-azoreductase [unclassified Thermoactinomyces]|jgi:FMN-dependent NADH-azoreductase|uniref:FMN-dependent NADH-azoreductase n=1 Tax=unclassified Thermoactinomyces TaxID=2634588 RepID=UPI0018DD3B4A|nr:MULTISPECIES: FMN-dependent NADH-azoreductase [unclassified Thermoactinomyces]MBH8596814.1 FMN-dependent NADH-azoreductase [Thermoactinomyces sp. CICC 10523]MBH8603574.1 FMN-dependent NADH-azoreductase [Thermoactinomyces sp. CICC 10522]MBH8606739.1 FMN-dependent NADH-azoreductase [Thermoactinomyces sp. CICC 10521]
MAKVLYITANPKPVDESFSLRVGKAFLERYKEIRPEDEIVELDLYKTEIPYIDEEVFSGWGKLAKGADLTPEEKKKVDRINELTEQFVSADKYVFVTPFWNFLFPPKLKAYIDTICIAGKTFKYTENGPVGLLKGKKAVHIQARGGVYSEGPAREVEFSDRYLRTVLQFIGITDVESVIAEGMAAFPEQADAILEKAIAHGQDVAASFAK